MQYIVEELDYQVTPLGAISLRRRSEPRLEGQILYEVKLDDDFLMSSLFTEAEIGLATLGLATQRGQNLNVVVGGLGLGYTAAAVLENPAVASLSIIEAIEPVIEWHEKGIGPLGRALALNSKCTMLHADFFDLATRNQPFDVRGEGKLVDAILLDIDHSPVHCLNPGNQSFYKPEGLRSLKTKLVPGGVFGLWSNDPPEPDFTALIESVFGSAESHIISFANPYSGEDSANTIYLAVVT
ncbi:MAG: spermidine synthase [bacterium]